MGETSVRPPAAPASPRTSGGAARERLLAAALERFEAEGPLAATLEDIRRDAGVSVGALYAALAEDFQQAFLAELRRHPGAEDGVRAGVACYLWWVSEHRAAAAFLLGERPAGDAELREHNRRFFAEVTAWWDGHVHYGVLRDLPFDVINALWLGPAHEYTRHWVAGRGKRVPATVAGVLSDAAWQTLKEAP